MEIKDKIRARRLQLGLTMEELANKVGVAKSTIKKWESGQINSMRQSKILALANALKVEPTYLIFEDENYNNNVTELTTNNNIVSISPIDNVILSLFQNLNEKDKTRVIKFATKLISNNQNKKG